MKRTSFLLLLATFMSLSVKAEVITPSRAVSIAEEFLGEELSPQHVRGMNRMAAAPEGEWAPYYVISRGEDKGFVLVSGDDCMPAVLGYAEQGDFDPNDMSPAFADMLECITRSVEAGQKEGASPYGPVTAPSGWVTINPLIKSHWHQGAPYNLLCPICSDNKEHAVVGCVATATSQAIYYFRKDLPQALQAKTPIYKGGDNQCDVTVSYPKGTAIEYDLMFDSYTNNEPEYLKKAVALLCFTVGSTSKMGYWHSSGAYISDANNTMRTHFGLSGTHLVRNNMNIKEWEDIIYRSLAAKKPIIYSGFTHDEEPSGHAINLDGYDASKGLWHFNFGWGGSGDGWYSLDLDKGVNGFSQWQEIVYDITPREPNLSGKFVDCDSVLYRRVQGSVSVAITNNGTVPYNNFNLYLQTTDKAPGSSNTPAATDKDTYIAPGETKTITFDVRPTLARTYYVYVTDANRHPLAHQPVVVREATPDLTLHGLTVQASGKKQQVGDKEFQIINNNVATLRADIQNSASGTDAQPSIRFQIFELDTETGEELSPKSKSITNIVFPSGGRQTVEYSFTKLPEGKRYVGRVSSEGWNVATADSLVRFVIGTPTLTIETQTDGTAVLTGEWDANLFQTLAGDDPAFTAYDLRAVAGVTAPLKAANPNALFYVSQPVEGTNIVVEGHCADLRLVPGHDFRPLAPFHAANASYVPTIVPGIYQPLILPFACQRPSEYLCRFVTDAGRSYFSETVTVDRMDAATPYLLLSSHTESIPFQATDVEVVAEPDTTVTRPFVASFTHRSLYAERTGGSSYILELDTNPESTTQYYLATDTDYVATPFIPMLCANTKKVRASAEETQEKAYKKLALALADLRDLYEAYRSVEPDTMNIAMQELIVQADRVWQAVEQPATEVNKLIKEMENLGSIYPMMANVFAEPIDFTSYISNPSFETNTKAGWKSDSHSLIRSVTTINTIVARCDGKFFLHNNNAGKATGISQTVEGLRTGYYRLSVLTATDEGGLVNIFAGDSTCAAPASELGKYYLAESVIDSVWVENGSLTIGIAAGDTWYKCDNFRLEFLGDGSDHTTAIRPVAPDTRHERRGIYTLDGRLVATPDDMLPGVIYIVNGRKTMKVE